MDLKAEILKSGDKAHVRYVTSLIGNDTKKFAQLMDIFFDKQYATRARIPWTVTHCAEAHPELLTPYLEKMILNLQTLS